MHIYIHTYICINDFTRASNISISSFMLMIQLYQVHKTFSVITYLAKISTEKDNVNVEQVNIISLWGLIINIHLK